MHAAPPSQRGMPQASPHFTTVGRRPGEGDQVRSVLSGPPLSVLSSQTGGDNGGAGPPVPVLHQQRQQPAPAPQALPGTRLPQAHHHAPQQQQQQWVLPRGQPPQASLAGRGHPAHPAAPMAAANRHHAQPRLLHHHWPQPQSGMHPVQPLAKAASGHRQFSQALRSAPPSSSIAPSAASTASARARAAPTPPPDNLGSNVSEASSSRGARSQPSSQGQRGAGQTLPSLRSFAQPALAQAENLLPFTTAQGVPSKAFSAASTQRQPDAAAGSVSSAGDSASSASSKAPGILRQLAATDTALAHTTFGVPFNAEHTGMGGTVSVADGGKSLQQQLSAACTPPLARIFTNRATLILHSAWKAHGGDGLHKTLPMSTWSHPAFCPPTIGHPGHSHNELLAGDLAVEMCSIVIKHHAERLAAAWETEDEAKAATARLMGLPPPQPAAGPPRTQAAALHFILHRVLTAMHKAVERWPVDVQRFTPSLLLLQSGTPAQADSTWISVAAEVPARLHWMRGAPPTCTPGDVAASIPTPHLQAATFGLSRVNKGGPEVPTRLPNLLEMFDETDHSVPQHNTSSLDPIIRVVAQKFSDIFTRLPPSLSLHQQRCEAVPESGLNPPDLALFPPAPRRAGPATAPQPTKADSSSQQGMRPPRPDDTRSSVVGSVADSTSGVDGPNSADLEDATADSYGDSASVQAAAAPLLNAAGGSYLPIPSPGTSLTLASMSVEAGYPTWRRVVKLVPARKVEPQFPTIVSSDSLPPRSGRGSKRPRAGGSPAAPAAKIPTSGRDGAAAATDEADALPDWQVDDPEGYTPFDFALMVPIFLFGRLMHTVALMDGLQVLCPPSS